MGFKLAFSEEVMMDGRIKQMKRVDLEEPRWILNKRAQKLRKLENAILKTTVLFIHSDVIYCKHISIITVVYFVIIIA